MWTSLLQPGKMWKKQSWLRAKRRTPAFLFFFLEQVIDRNALSLPFSLSLTRTWVDMRWLKSNQNNTIARPGSGLVAQQTPGWVSAGNGGLHDNNNNNKESSAQLKQHSKSHFLSACVALCAKTLIEVLEGTLHTTNSELSLKHWSVCEHMLLTPSSWLEKCIYQSAAGCFLTGWP